jgi:ferric-dicitrate binding protein FerR (iron transport regulator)
MANQINDSLIHRFLNKETSEQENTEILDWVSVSEENRSEFRNVHKIYHLSKLIQYRSEIDVDLAWENLNRELPRPTRKLKVIHLPTFGRIAAVVLLFLAAGFGSLWTFEHFISKPKPVMVQFEAPSGEKSKIVLADGSKVWLNSQSVLNYDVNNPREVSLDGEGYFEVQKEHNHPFVINSPSGMKVMVTGTRFNLRTYTNEPFVETSLEEGEVIITNRNSKQLAVLKPGQQARYYKNDEQVQILNVVPENYSVWKNNELRFTDVSFKELIPQIECWYGVSVNIELPATNSDHFTFSIKTESLRELLNMMQLTSKFDYEINGQQIRIRVK